MSDTELFKTIFAAKLRTVEPSEEEMQEAKASITALKDLLPEGINPEDDPDLLYIAADLAVAGMVNLNDDGLDIPTALAVYKKFEKKQVNIEHNRKQICGYIIHAGLSEIGTNRILTEEEARALNKPFNISTVAVLWKVANKELCNYIIEASNPSHSEYNSLSLSFEMGFKNYYIASLPEGEIDIAKANKIITTEDEDFPKFSQSLRAYKGSGVSPVNNNNRLYRIMPQNVIPLGQGIVSVPAAAVRGITVIDEAPAGIEPTTQEVDTKAEAIREQQLAEALKAKESLLSLHSEINKLIEVLDKKNVDNIIFNKNGVLNSTETFIKSSRNKNMNKDLQKIKDQVATLEKPEDFKQVFANVSVLADAIATESERLARELETEKNKAAEFEKAKTEVQAAHTKLSEEFNSLKKQLEEIRAQQLQAEIENKFNERMETLDEEFELDDDTRSLLVEDVKSCADDAAFAKLVEKSKKLMKEKTKSFIKNKKEEEKKKDEEVKAALASKGLKQVVVENKVNFEEVIASAKDNEISAPINNVVNVNANTTSLRDQVKAAFAESVQIGGKKLSELSKKE